MWVPKNGAPLRTDSKLIYTVIYTHTSFEQHKSRNKDLDTIRALNNRTTTKLTLIVYRKTTITKQHDDCWWYGP